VLAKLVKSFGLLRQDFAALKTDFKRLEQVRQVVKNGKDGVSPDLEKIVISVLERIPPAKDGVSPDINAIVEAAAKLIPEPKAGRDAVAPSIRDIADVVLANIEKPKDGVSPDPKVLAAAAARLIRVPKDGESPTPEAVAARLPTPKRGPPGKDGVSVTDVKLTNNELFVFLDGKKKSAGKIKVPDAKAPTTTASPFSPGGGGGGGRQTPAKKYYESNSVEESSFPTGPQALIPGLSLVTAGESTPYQVQTKIQFTTFPELATPILLTDLTALTAELNALPGGVAHGADFGGGEVLQAGVYTVASASTHSGVLTFDGEGDADALFVIIVNGAEAISTLATTSVINGAQSCNIFWVVVGALTIGDGCSLKGTYIGSGAIGANTLTLEGRILTPTGALALTSSNITVPTGLNTSLNLGYLTTIILYTGAGAISNTVVTSGIIGSVASNLGTVTGFPNLQGIIYTANSRVIDAVFVLTSNGVAIPSSTVRFTMTEGAEFREFFQRVYLFGVALKPEQQDIDIKVTVALGALTVGNRNILAVEL
jgi:hypothetical protein